MPDAADILRARRETVVTVGTLSFTVRRPRALDLARWQSEGNAAVALHSVAGWSGVTLGDLYGTEDDQPAPYSAALAAEWLPDRMDLLLPIWQAVEAMIQAHEAAREALRGN